MDYRLAHVPYQARQASRGIQFVEDIYPELVMKRILRVNFCFSLPSGKHRAAQAE